MITVVHRTNSPATAPITRDGLFFSKQELSMGGTTTEHGQLSSFTLPHSLTVNAHDALLHSFNPELNQYHVTCCACDLSSLLLRHYNTWCM